MIEINKLTGSDKGRSVIYTSPQGEKQTGRISSWNNVFIFVWYSWGAAAAATVPKDLEFEMGGPSK